MKSNKVEKCGKILTGDPIYKRMSGACHREKGHEGGCTARLTDDDEKDKSQVRPQHYKLFIRAKADHAIACGDALNQTIEVIDVVEALGYQDDAYLATALIYLMRLRRKEQPVVDVKKAIWWLQRWLAAQEDPTT